MFSNKWQFWLGGGVSLALLLLLLYQVDLGEIKDALREANYFLLAPSVAIYFVAVLFRAVRWRYLLAPMGVFPVRRLYPVVIIGYMANNLLPVRLGEVVRSYYLSRQETVNTSSALATIAVERVFDGLTLLFFAAVVSLFLPLVGLLHGLGERAGIPWVLLALAMSMPFPECVHDPCILAQILD